MSNLLILLVEDNPEDTSRIRDFVMEKPALHGRLKVAETLDSALSLLSHYDFDVVLLDLGLPDSSGMDTARRIIGGYPETAVIVLSGPTDEEVALQAVRYGAEDHLEKSAISSAMLAKSICYAIERKKILLEKYDVLSDLVLALEKIETLERILPICAGCKKIYHKDRHWLTLEEYSRCLTDAGERHPICPDCREHIENIP
jgi:DNA-binding response OmpR family regulator